MHSLLFSAVVCALITVELCVGLSAVPVDLMVACMAVAVTVIGLPHGADDQRVALQIMDRLFPSSANVLITRWMRMVLFSLGYLAIAAAVVAGWFWAPIVTILAFFALSAWHFGSEEEHLKLHKTIFRIPFTIACGGMVIWVPVLFQAEAVESLLRIIVPENNLAVANPLLTLTSLIELLKIFSIACLLILVMGLCFSSWTTRLDAVWRIRTVLLFALLACTDPLVGFTVYFCGWHSIGELIRFQEQHGGAALARLVPMTVAAIALFAAGFATWQWTNGQLWSENLTRTIFIGLSAVAIPHLLLHFCEHQAQELPTANRIGEV